MIEWPEILIEELAAKRAIIFIGAGVSASCQSSLDPVIRPPSWYQLLEQARDQFVNDEIEKAFINHLIETDQLLDAAEVIFDRVTSAQKRSFFTDIFARPRFVPSELHALIQRINSKIVITTNYDQIYETQCDALTAGQGFVIRKYYENRLLNSVRFKDNLIIKAHGCVSDTTKLILTRSDYFHMKSEHSEFYNVLNSLLTVHTVLFLGCGMSDPDIQLVLENTNIAASSDHPHYAVMPKGKHPSLIKAMQKSYNLNVLEYEVGADGNHSVLVESLQELQSQVDSLRPVMMGS